MGDRVKLIDVSHWRVNVPWRSFHDHGWVAAYIKADDKAEVHVQDARQAGYQRLGLYFWHDPTLSVERNVSKVLDYLSRIKVEFVVIDVEHWWASWSEWWLAQRGQLSWSQVRQIPGQLISDHAEKLCQQVEGLIDLPLLVYSARWFIHDYAPQINTWLDRYPYINADYSYVPGRGQTLDWDQINQIADSVGYSHYLPAGVKRETIRQFSDKIYLKETGDNYDLNVYFGSLDEFDSLIKLGEVKPAPQEEPLYTGTFTAWYQWVRSGPDKTYPHVDYLTRHQKVQVYEEQNGWGRIGENRWTHLYYIAPILGSGICKAWYLYVREGPGTNYKDVGYITNGTRVEIYKRENNWGRIHPSQERWVSLNWIEEE